jgi:hypothetical protein
VHEHVYEWLWLYAGVEPTSGEAFVLFLPLDNPELNPAERWFEALGRVVANRHFDTLDELAAALKAALRPCWDHPGKLRRLAAYPWSSTALETSRTNRNQPREGSGMPERDVGIITSNRYSGNSSLLPMAAPRPPDRRAT